MPDQFTKEEVYQDPNDSRVKTVHKSATGEEPLYVTSETLVNEHKLEAGGTDRKQLPFRLDELVKDFYMFSLAPLYVTALWDARRQQQRMNVLYQFGVEMKFERIPQVLDYRSPLPLFRGDAGEWDYRLEGIPKDIGYLFGKFVEQMVMVDREVRPMRYWRARRKTIAIVTPGVVSEPAEIDVFLPSGLDGRLDMRPNPDGSWGFIQMPSEDWIIAEANRYFERMNP